MFEYGVCRGVSFELAELHSSISVRFVSVWLNPSVSKDDNLDHKVLFDIHRRATANAIKKAVNDEPSIDWLLENQEKIVHKYYQMGLDKKI